MTAVVSRRDARWERVSRWESRTWNEFRAGMTALSGLAFFVWCILVNAGSIQ